MFRTNCIMHFLRSSSVCVLPRIFFRCAHIKLLYIDINGIASYRIGYKEYIDISYKLDIPPSPRFRSYLEVSGYYVSIGEHKSKWTSMTCGVPQGSSLAPLLFSLYMLPLSQIMTKNQIAYHSYADDTQIYLALSPNDYSPIDSLCRCIDEINSWSKLKSLHLETKMKCSR